MSTRLPEPQRRQFLRTSLNQALWLAGLTSMQPAAHAAPSASAAAPRTLRIGLAADVSSMDPHWNNSGPNNAMALHVFESLVLLDQDARYIPGLATSWRPLSPTVWEIRLRAGVRWHDGTPFTSTDVKASLERPARLKGSPGPFTGYTKTFAAIDTPDPLTVRLTTAVANYANIANDLNSVAIVPHKVAQLGQTAFDSGAAMIGTGPFRFVRYARGQEIVLRRNPDYWGGASAWETVTFKILTNNGTRTAALLSGSVDAIESVPSADVARLRRHPDFRLEQAISWRVIFWQMDQWRDASPYITDLAGAPLGRNPFKDVRVRQAISKALRREVLCTRLMEGLAVPASSLVSAPIFGHPGTPFDAYDPDGARRLLADAGYPQGFGLTLHATNNRYLNDSQVAQATAQMLSRIGIRTRVEVMPVASYFSKARAGAFSFQMLGWGSSAGDVALRSILGSPNNKTGYGTWNWGHYSNPALDQLIARSLSTISSPQDRETVAREAVRLANADHAVIPSHSQMATWAMRRGIRYRARTDEWSLAHQFLPA